MRRLAVKARDSGLGLVEDAEQPGQLGRVRGEAEVMCRDAARPRQQQTGPPGARGHSGARGEEREGAAFVDVLTQGNVDSRDLVDAARSRERASRFLEPALQVYSGTSSPAFAIRVASALVNRLAVPGPRSTLAASPALAAYTIVVRVPGAATQEPTVPT